MKFSLVIFLALYFASGNCWIEFNNTYDNVSECKQLCDRDFDICKNWMTVILELNLDFSDCSTIKTGCYSLCETDPKAALGTSRCQYYHDTLWPLSNQNTQSMTLATEGCFHEAPCLTTCLDDILFCYRNLGYYFSQLQCEALIGVNCYTPCMGDNTDWMQEPPTVRHMAYIDACDNLDLSNNLFQCSDIHFPYWSDPNGL